MVTAVYHKVKRYGIAESFFAWAITCNIQKAEAPWTSTSAS